MTHKCHQMDNIEWIKGSLKRIEAGHGRRLELIGQTGLCTQNLATEIHAKVKAHRWQIRAAWGVIGTMILTAVTGVTIYLLKYHHIHKEAINGNNRSHNHSIEGNG